MGKHNFVKYYRTTAIHSAQLMRLGDKGDDLGPNLGPGLSTKLVAKPMGSSCLAMEAGVMVRGVKLNYRALRSLNAREFFYRFFA